MPAFSLRLLGAVVTLALGAFPAGAEDDPDQPRYPTTAFEDGATSASVSVGDVTAGVSYVRRPQIDPAEDIPLLTVMAGGRRVIEVPGVASGFDFPAADASIAEIDPGNGRPEVYFTSYSGGAHCCSTVIVATETPRGWVAVPVGEFDGDGDYLDNLNGDGVAEVATVDNRFLYTFDCYACSAAPLVIYGVRDGRLVDLSADRRFLAAHRDWLRQLEEGVDPADRWTSPGFLAGWVAAKIRVGEGADAWRQLGQRWKSASDPGEQVCTSGGEPEDCPKQNLAVLKFPDRLRLFLEQAGYR